MQLSQQGSGRLITGAMLISKGLASLWRSVNFRQMGAK